MLGKRTDLPYEDRPESSDDQGGVAVQDQSQKFKKKGDSLEIEKMRETIVEQIDLNQVTIISGETGCGKSTQVPQYILQDLESRKERCKILCTQPRRIACISIAKRVASELGKKVGDLVGYHISMDARLDSSTKITFVTNGILLNYLTHNPSILSEYTHIIIDEVHERDIDSDFILILFKLFLAKFPDFKLILMSATINAELFARYFSKESIREVANCDFDALLKKNEGLKSSKADPKREKVDKVQTWDNFDYGEFDVKSHWKTKEVRDLEDVQKAAQISVKQSKVVQAEKNLPMATILEIDSRRKYEIKELYLDQLTKEFPKFECSLLRKMGEFNFNKRRAVVILEVMKVAVQLVQFLHENEKYIKFPTKKIENGGILIFLPGLNEITFFIQMLTDMLHPDLLKQLNIIPLHSTIAQIYEKDIFSQNGGLRKVIVCTNIAESSLTIPDIIFVIDFCLSKEFKFDTKTQTQRLDLVWASKASCKQRTGRSGRVCDGISFRLVSHHFFDELLDDFAEAEILRSPLEKIILKICVLHEEIERKNDLLRNTPKSLTSDTMSKVNDILLTIANKVFKDPRSVLQIAIERPSFDQIDYAMNFLVSNGAFKYVNKSENKGKITFLGRIYSDLPCNLQIIKLLLYGHIFGCFEDALTIGVMMMHPKSIWVPRTSKTMELDFLKFYYRIDALSDGEFSDHILFLNMFKDWHAQFGDQGDLSNMRGRKPRSNPESRWNRGYRQKDWYRDHNVRQGIMQEIMASRFDIRKRMARFLNFNDKQRDLQHMSPDEKKTHYLKLKLAVGGASMPNYALGVFRPNSKQKNEISHIINEIGLDPLHCVNLYEIPLYKMLNSYNKTILEEADLAISDKYSSISDEEKIVVWKTELLRNIQGRYGEVSRLSIQPRIAYVQFAKESSDLSIRSLLFDKNYRKGLTSMLNAYSMEDQGMTSVAVECVPKNISSIDRRGNQLSSSKQDDLMSDLNKTVKRMVQDISDVSYNFIPYYENMFTGSSLIIENLSIANIITRARPGFKPDATGEEKLFVVYSDEVQANSKNFLAKNTTLMPDIPFLLELMIMIFSNTVYLEAGDKYERLTHVKTGSSDVPLGHWLSRGDVITVNRLRSSLKVYFEEQEEKKAAPEFIWEDMLRLLKVQREPFYQADQWFDYFTANLKVSIFNQEIIRRLRRSYG